MPSPRPTPSRRQFLTAAALAASMAPLAAACSKGAPLRPRALATAIQSTERLRPHTGTIRNFTLSPQPQAVRIADRSVDTWAYGSAVPGPVLRANVGDELAVKVANRLPDPTSVHWHGIALRNDMDGVSPASGNIAAGDEFTYRFSVPDAGTYWFHPHVGVQADYGMYGALIVDDPHEPASYDLEWVVVLDDWTDGVGSTPPQILSSLRKGSMAGMSGGSMSGMTGMGSSVGTSVLLGGDAGDVSYPLYLINGRTDPAPVTFSGKPGQRVRLRIINAAADTAFRIALGDHALTVTHTDGFPIQPQVVDALLLGMGERYDAIVTLGDGVFPLTALAEGKSARARALVRTGQGVAPAVSVISAQLTQRVGSGATFAAAASVTLADRTPDVLLTARLAGDMASYVWTVNGRTYDRTVPLVVQAGQRVRLTFQNTSMMWHPMHLHGHTFQVQRPGGAGARKDTAIVLPMQSLSVDFDADNPGRWMLHCHNAYHAEAGMMTRVDYQT